MHRPSIKSYENLVMMFTPRCDGSRSDLYTHRLYYLSMAMRYVLPQLIQSETTGHSEA